MFDILLRYIHTSVFGFVMPLIYCILILERYCVSVVYSYILHSPSESQMLKAFQRLIFILHKQYVIVAILSPTAR